MGVLDIIPKYFVPTVVMDFRKKGMGNKILLNTESIADLMEHKEQNFFLMMTTLLDSKSMKKCKKCPFVSMQILKPIINKLMKLKDL